MSEPHLFSRKGSQGEAERTELKQQDDLLNVALALVLNPIGIRQIRS
jgi:hypothetical protein